MSDIREQLASIPDVIDVSIDKIEVHGERAVEVIATLQDGRTVTGTFTTEDKPAFGGVTFYNRKDVSVLMSSKIRNVLDGTADVN